MSTSNAPASPTEAPKGAAITFKPSYTPPTERTVGGARLFWIGTIPNLLKQTVELGGVSFPMFTGFRDKFGGDQLTDTSWEKIRDVKPGAVMPLTTRQLERVKYEAERHFYRITAPTRGINQVIETEKNDTIKVAKMLLADRKAASPDPIIGALLDSMRTVPEIQLLDIVHHQGEVGIRENDLPVGAFCYAIPVPEDLVVDSKGEWREWRPDGYARWRWGSPGLYPWYSNPRWRFLNLRKEFPATLMAMTPGHEEFMTKIDAAWVNYAKDRPYVNDAGQVVSAPEPE